MATDAGHPGRRRRRARSGVVPWPPELAGPFDTRPAVLWRPDDAGFVVMHWQRPWLVDLEGNGEPAPFGDRNNSQVMVDPDTGRGPGEQVAERDDHVVGRGPRSSDRVPRRGYGERFVTRYGLAAYTGSPGQFDLGVMKSGPIVRRPGDRGRGRVRPHPRRRRSVYSDNGHLDGDGLPRRGDGAPAGDADGLPHDAGPKTAVTHLVAWDLATGDFSLLASGGPGMRSVAVAPDLVD